MSFKSRWTVFPNRLLLLVFVISLSACNKKSSEPSEKLFVSPDDAGQALITAVRAGDPNALLTIFGPDSKQLIFSGDAVQDKNVANAFASAYERMHRWRKMPDSSQILVVGADNFPFPIPLKKNDDGQWFFDTVAGKDEILSRRVGRNELTVIDVCEAVGDAQAEYVSRLHQGDATKQYAAKFISDPGKQNGLYWESSDGQPESPLGPLAAFAASEGYRTKPDTHMAFHGYFFRMLKGQGKNAPGGARSYLVDGKMVGGFAFVAYPAEYGNSGVMTFVMNQDGLLLQKDLGKATTEIATAMSEFDPDISWSQVFQ